MEIFEEKRCYIVSEGVEWDYMGYEWHSHVFQNREDAEQYMNDQIYNWGTDNGYSREQITEIKEECGGPGIDTIDYFEDPEYKWVIKLEDGTFHQRKID